MNNIPHLNVFGLRILSRYHPVLELFVKAVLCRGQ